LDVFFYEAFEEEAQALKRYLPSGISAGFIWKTIQEYGDSEPIAPIISLRTQSIIPISWAAKIKAVLTRSTGYDHIKSYLQECKINIPAGYLPLYCNRAVAEQAMLLWMALLRKLPLQMQSFFSFSRDGLTGQECKHKTLLIVGVGNIGYEIVKIGNGLGMNVLGVDIVKKHSGVSYVSIEQGLRQADIIVCAMNLTADNVAYFNYNLLKEAKPGVVFINIARGELSPSVDLLRLLNEGRLSGMALDVYNKEAELAVSLRAGRPSDEFEVKAALELAKHQNVIMTPHNAFNTHQSVENKAQQSVEQINSFLKNGTFLWPVPS
jgi:D-lactate dehydrogenase